MRQEYMMDTYTYRHPRTGRPVYTRTLGADGLTSTTRWHVSNRTTTERAEQVGETSDGAPTYVWVQTSEVRH